MTCAVCGEPVQRNQMELEINSIGTARRRNSIATTCKCYAAWELERKKAAPTSAA